ncbi:hypothetical protein ACK37G_15395, partial [Aeromonas veronii]
RGMVVIRSLGFQLVPFKLHRFRKQRPPYLFRQSAGVVWLSTIPLQSNKRGELRPDSSGLPALYRRTLVWRGLIVC